MSRIACFVALMLAGACTQGGVMLTAEVSDTPGMPGYQTYDISAWSPLGYIAGFDFLEGVSGGGIVGSLAQATASPTGGVWYDPLYTDGSLNDSHWLFSQGEGLQIRASQSGSGLYGAFTFRDSEAVGAPRSRSIARLVTNDPSSVTIGGDFDVREYWDDGTRVGAAKHRVDVRLSDLQLGAPSTDNSFPAVPDDVLAERQRQAEREAAAEAYRERMANWRPEPEPPAAPTPTPVEPEPVPPTTPAEPPEVPATAVVTLEDYQSDLDSQAAAIQRQIDALKLNLNEVINQRTASEEPGFQVPTYRGGTIRLVDSINNVQSNLQRSMREALLERGAVIEYLDAGRIESRQIGLGVTLASIAAVEDPFQIQAIEPPGIEIDANPITITSVAYDLYGINSYSASTSDLDRSFATLGEEGSIEVIAAPEPGSCCLSLMALAAAATRRRLTP